MRSIHWKLSARWIL
ncbi:MAG: hypothetical protein ACLVJO_09750 [[Clostridium] scindens]